jgi:hypothetical protein
VINLSSRGNYSPEVPFEIGTEPPVTITYMIGTPETQGVDDLPTQDIVAECPIDKGHILQIRAEESQVVEVVPFPMNVQLETDCPRYGFVPHVIGDTVQDRRRHMIEWPGTRREFGSVEPSNRYG